MTWLSLGTGLWRKPTRTVLATLSLTLAFVLFLLLRALGAAVTGASASRAYHDCSSMPGTR